MAMSIEDRRKLRAMEAKRDSLLLKKKAAITELAKLRATMGIFKKGANKGR